MKPYQKFIDALATLISGQKYTDSTNVIKAAFVLFNGAEQSQINLDRFNEAMAVNPRYAFSQYAERAETAAEYLELVAHIVGVVEEFSAEKMKVNLKYAVDRCEGEIWGSYQMSEAKRKALCEFRSAIYRFI